MPPILTAIIVSACLGALVGLIRQWSSDQTSPAGEVDLGGVRTYTFWAMLGAVAAFLGETHAPALLAVVITLVGLQQIVSLHRVPPTQHTGGTTFASALLTILVGALVYWGYRQSAVLVAATTMVMLGMKQTLHAWTRAFKLADIRATLQFVAITGVILPLVPNRTFGPFDAFNPFSTWLMVILISGLGFIGYIAMRFLGARAGILLTSLLGGLASSTATTLAFSKRSKEDPGLSNHYAMAVITACSVMLPRVVIAVGVLNPTLAVELIAPFLLMTLPAAIYGLWLRFARRPAAGVIEAPLALTNPLSLATASSGSSIRLGDTQTVLNDAPTLFSSGTVPSTVTGTRARKKCASTASKSEERTWSTAPSSSQKSSAIGALRPGKTTSMPKRPANAISARQASKPPSERSW